MLKPVIRSFAFLANWAAWVVRQPAMILTMVLGPFLILGLFALSGASEAPRARVIVVQPPPSDQQISVPTEIFGTFFDIAAETTDADWAGEQLRQRSADAVLILPADPQAQLAQGQQATILVQTNEIDPINLAFLNTSLGSQIADLNKEVLRRGVERAKSDAAAAVRRLDSVSARLDRIDQQAQNREAVREEVDALEAEHGPVLASVPAMVSAARAGAILLPSDQAQAVSQQVAQAEQAAATSRRTLEALKAAAASPRTSPTTIRLLARTLRSQVSALSGLLDAFQSIPAQILVQPFDSRLEQIAPYQPTIITFYAPAALALLLQHFAVTFAALSMVRARFLGMVEFWRIAPIRASEIVVGNYLSYGLLTLAAWAALTAAVVYFLEVPILGSVYYLFGSAGLLILASLGIGFVISLLAGSEQQAAQLAMLVLLGSVFLSGFVRPLEAIDFPVRYASFLLPATFSIQLFQDIMLRGLPGQAWQLGGLSALTILGFWTALLLFHRELRPT